MLIESEEFNDYDDSELFRAGLWIVISTSDAEDEEEDLSVLTDSLSI